MKKSKFTEARIAYALRQVESGTPPADVCRQLGVSEATFYALILLGKDRCAYETTRRIP